jgi:hypothetical protein
MPPEGAPSLRNHAREALYSSRRPVKQASIAGAVNGIASSDERPTLPGVMPANAGIRCGRGG